MKANLNIVLDLGDEVVECDGGTENCAVFNISEEIQRSLKSKLRYEILEKISDEQINSIRDEIATYVINEIKSFVLGKISSEFSALTIERNGVMIDAKEFIVDKLKTEIDCYDSSRKVKAVAEEYAKTLKDRYDVLFCDYFSRNLRMK